MNSMSTYNSEKDSKFIAAVAEEKRNIDPNKLVLLKDQKLLIEKLGKGWPDHVKDLDFDKKRVDIEVLPFAKYKAFSNRSAASGHELSEKNAAQSRSNSVSKEFIKALMLLHAENSSQLPSSGKNMDEKGNAILNK